MIYLFPNQDHGLPEGLGVGTRVPGFKPYFNFIRDHIFLKFSTRGYKNMEEKWEIGSLVLKLVLKLLKDYAPNVQEFNAGQGSLGFGIMTHLLQSSQMLRLVLHLLGMFTYLDCFRKLILSISRNFFKLVTS